MPAKTSELIRSTRRAYLRTARHPAAAAFPEVATFDHHYEAADTFEDVYRRIVDDLVGAAGRPDGDGEVVYAVPGSPLIAERSVELLRADPRVELVAIPATSFLDLAWDRLGVDPLAASVRLVDAGCFERDAAGERGPLLVAQAWSEALLSRVKLALDGAAEVAGVEPPRVTVLHHLGLEDEVVTEVPAGELDRTVVPDHLTTVWVPTLAAPLASAIVALDELVRRLRRDCPWDAAQTHTSLTRHLLEETYEVLDAIADLEGAEDPEAADRHLEEELGDLLFQVCFHARLAAEEGRFTLTDVAAALERKLVSRHPHVFGDARAEDVDAVLDNWEALKKEEKGRASVTDGIPAALPALSLAATLQRKAAHLEAAPVATRGAPALDAEGAGELLWVVADFVRRSGVDPEDALRTRARSAMQAIRDAEGAP